MTARPSSTCVLPVGLDDIRQARARIGDRVRTTPLEASPTLAEIAGVPVSLKLEHMQITGSFKLRGATNAVLRLSDDERARGVVGVSTGNHGRALARASRLAGIRCIICLSELVPQTKIDGIRAQGAQVRVVGRSQDEAQTEVDRLIAEHGMTMIPPFDHPAVIAGQGTLGLEIAAEAPDIATLLVPLSGGGLIAGVAAAMKALKPEVRIVGLSMERGAAMIESLKAGRPVKVEEAPSLADSLGGGIGLDNHHTFRMVKTLVDDTITLTEAEIAAGMRHLYREERQVVEGASAVGVAAILAGKLRLAGPTVALVTGRNVDMNQHFQVISAEEHDTERERAWG